jgi:antitoxin VapB
VAFETINIKDISGLQSIEIPDNFKINDDKVYLKKVGNALYIIPFHNPWESLIDGVNEFSQDFMEARNQPDDQTRQSFD